MTESNCKLRVRLNRLSVPGAFRNPRTNTLKKLDIEHIRRYSHEVYELSDLDQRVHSPGVFGYRV